MGNATALAVPGTGKPVIELDGPYISSGITVRFPGDRNVDIALPVYLRLQVPAAAVDDGTLARMAHPGSGLSTCIQDRVLSAASGLVVSWLNSPELDKMATTLLDLAGQMYRTAQTPGAECAECGTVADSRPVAPIAPCGWH